jgi:hypothetical protein
MCPQDYCSDERRPGWSQGVRRKTGIAKMSRRITTVRTGADLGGTRCPRDHCSEDRCPGWSQDVHRITTVKTRDLSGMRV